MNVLKVNNKEYILKYNFRALSDLQERGMSFTSDVEFKFRDVVVLLHIGLRKFHPDLTEDLCFDLMDDILEEMGLEDVMKIISKAMEQSLGKNNPNPNK